MPCIQSDSFTTTQRPKTSGSNVASGTPSRPSATSFGQVRCSPHDMLPAQRNLCIARRRLFLVRTVYKFESHFGYPLWEHEKEHLAALLMVERPGNHKSYTQHKYPDKQRTKDLSKNHQYLKKDKIHVQPAQPSDTTVQKGKNASYERDTIEDESDKGEEEEIERESQWLGAEWESIVKILRQKESDSNWDDEY